MNSISSALTYSTRSTRGSLHQLLCPRLPPPLAVGSGAGGSTYRSSYRNFKFAKADATQDEGPQVRTQLLAAPCIAMRRGAAPCGASRASYLQRPAACASMRVHAAALAALACQPAACAAVGPMRLLMQSALRTLHHPR